MMRMRIKFIEDVTLFGHFVKSGDESKSDPEVLDEGDNFEFKAGETEVVDLWVTEMDSPSAKVDFYLCCTFKWGCRVFHSVPASCFLLQLTGKGEGSPHGTIFASLVDHKP
jgi:hypothetical protein